MLTHHRVEARIQGVVGAATAVRDHGRLAVAVFAMALGVLVFWLAHAGLSDDGYITLDYARNLALHGHWGLTAELPSNTATSPLQVIALAFVLVCLHVFTAAPSPIVALGVVTVVSLVAMAIWCDRVVSDLRLPRVTSVIVVSLVILQPLALSSIGLETALLTGLLFGLLSMAIRRRPVLFGVLAGLCVLARLDMVIFVLAIGLCHPAIRRAWWRWLVTLLCVTLPWFVFSWLHLGSAIPTTLAIKQFQDYPGGWTFADGLALFARGTPLPTVVAVVPAALGFVALVAWPFFVLRRASRGRALRLHPVAVFAAAGLAYFGLYAALGVPPYVWYYAPTLIPLVAFFGVAVGAVVRLREGVPRTAALGSAVVLILAALGTDLSGGLPWRAPPIFGNYAMPSDYARVGSQLRSLTAGAAVQSPGELGALTYYCHCEMIDQFSDPGRALPFVQKQLHSSGGVGRWLLKLNYHNLSRTTKPVPLHYHLVWEPGWVEQRTGVWNVWSPASGLGHLVLYGL